MSLGSMFGAFTGATQKKYAQQGYANSTRQMQQGYDDARGIGEDYYPLPWSLLTYNPRLEGYEVNIAEQQLKGAPHYGKHESWDWSDRTRERKVYDHYGVAPYWGV